MNKQIVKWIVVVDERSSSSTTVRAPQYLLCRAINQQGDPKYHVLETFLSPQLAWEVCALKNLQAQSAAEEAEPWQPGEPEPKEQGEGE